MENHITWPHHTLGRQGRPAPRDAGGPNERSDMEATSTLGIEWDGNGRRSLHSPMGRVAALGTAALMLLAPLGGAMGSATKTKTPDVGVIVRAVPGAAATAEKAAVRLGAKIGL